MFNIKTTREFTRKIDGNERKLFEVLHLVKSLPEVLCCIDESGRVKEYKSIHEILDDFIHLRLKYYQKRKDLLVEDFKLKLVKLASKYYFIHGIVNGTIIINKRKKDNIIAQLEKIDKIKKVNGSYEYLLILPISKLTSEEIDRLKEEIEQNKKNLLEIKETSIEKMWLDDLRELLKLF